LIPGESVFWNGEPYIATDPLLDSLRSEGEFANLMNAARQRHEEFKSKFF